MADAHDDVNPESNAPRIAAQVLDSVLTIQIAVAWAGEGGEEEPRLGWWRTDLASEYGGEDLFRRLLPHTWRWATLEAVREAARRTDIESRNRAHNPDSLVSLFHFGFLLDEQLNQRLADLKRSYTNPKEALPDLQPVIRDHWDIDAFAGWLRELGQAQSSAAPSGRRLEGQMPNDRGLAARRLAAALVPFPDAYPMPHYRESP